MKKRFMQFVVFSTLLAAVCAVPMLPLKVADAASGSLSASSQYIYIPSGLGSVTITYSTSGCSTAQVYVNTDNTYDKLMTQGASGTCNIGWIQAGYAYTFKLYANTTRTELLDTITVVGYGTNSGVIGAHESEIIMPSGLGTVELTWGTNGYSTAQVYVEMDNNNSEALMTQYASGTTSPAWIQDGHKYEFKLYANTSHTTLLDSVAVYGRTSSYGAGANYHATGTDFDSTYFLRDYHVTSVRNTVLSQLQGMANAGATHLRIGMWMSLKTGNEDAARKWRYHFPPTTQEMTNLHTYAQDVAAIQASDGHRLFLDVEMYWTYASDYSTGTPTTTLGADNLSPSVFSSNVVSTYQGIINQVYNVYRPDGKKIVSSVCFDNETMSCKANMLWLFGNTTTKYDGVHYCSGLYAGFVSYCQSHGLTPALEVNTDLSTADGIMSTTLPDYTYTLLDGHRPMYWPYRTLKLFRDNNIYIPEKVDFSMYPAKGSYTYSQIITKIFDDANAVLPSLGIRQYYGATEMYYFPSNATERAELGAALSAERLRNDRLTLVEFWTCPGGGGPSAYPFDFADYLP